MPRRPRVIVSATLIALLCASGSFWTTRGAAQNPPAPLQFPPRGTGLSADEKATLQTAVDRLAAQIASLKQRHRTGPLSERIADAEVYLDAVRRPLKYDERLYAPTGLHAGRVRAQDAR